MTDKPQEAGYRIRGTFYPAAISQRLGDAALVEQITGLTVQEYSRRARAQIEEAKEALRRHKEARERGDIPQDSEIEVTEFDELVSIATIAMAVSRMHPGWSRTRVSDFVAGLEYDDIEFVGGTTEDEEKDADDGPPAQQETPSNPGSTSPQQLRSVSEPHSNGSETQQTSGQSTSPMSPVAP